MKSLRKKILASALAVTLVGGIFAPKASAVDATEEQIWKDLKITKILNKVEKGVTTPDVNFEFKFEPVTKGAPNIDKVITIPFKAADNTDADGTEQGVQVEKTENVDLSGIQWTEAGIYEYKLYEVIPDTPMKDMDYGYYLYNGNYSKQKVKTDFCYRVSFKVKKVGDQFNITDIVVKTHRGGKIFKKMDYDSKKGVKFKNYYDKKDGNTPEPGGGTDITEDDKKGFAFKKTVVTKYPEDNDKSFEFTVKVDKAVGSNSKDTEFKYVIVDKDGNVGGEQTAAYGAEFKVNLKHKERVVFTDVILGSKVSVEETNTQELTPSVEGTLLEAQKGEKSITGIIGDNNGGNFAEITNTNDDTPLTGVLIDNLPYIALVAVAGLGIFFFVKNRREEEIYA